MAATAVFQADFSRWDKALESAKANLKSFEVSAKGAQAQLTNLAKGFSGERLIREAKATAAAIEAIGGPSKLTANELQRAGEKAKEAAEKMRALGKDVPADIQKLADTVKGPFMTALGKIGPAMLAAFSVTAITAAVKKVLDFASHLTDLSAKTGISTTGLQKLQIAFEQSGVSLDTVSTAVSKFQANLIGGDKSAVGALNLLGLSVEELKKANPEQAFLQVADAIGQIENPAEKSYAAIKIFGRGGAEVLQGLTGELSETVMRAEELGLVMSEETVKAADDFGDQLSILGKQLLALGASALAPLLPLVSKFADMLLWLGNNVIGPVVNIAIKGLVTGLAILWERLAEILSRLAAVGSKLPFVGDQFKSLSEWLKQSALSSGKFVETMWTGTEKVAVSAPKASRAIRGFGAAAEDSAKATAKIEKEADQAAKAFEKLTERVRSVESSDVTFKTLALADALSQVGKTINIETEPAMRKWRAVLNQTEGDVARVEQHARILNFGFQGMADGLENVGTKVNPAMEPLIRTLKEAEKPARSLGDSLKSLLRGDLGQVFKDLGGFFKGGIGEVGTGFLRGIGDGLLGMVSNLLSKGLSAIGKAIGGLFRNEEVEKVNDMRDAFEDTFGTLEDMHVAFNQVGLDIQKVLKADTVEEMNAVMEEYRERVVAVSEAFGALEHASSETFGVIPEHMKPALQALLDMGALTEDQRAKIKSLLDGTAVDFEGLTTLAKNYGISLEQLGPKFQQANLDKLAAQYAKDFELLSTAGADVNGLLVGMQDEVQGLLDQAFKFGGQIPDAMKPLLDAMVASGLLVDENGQKLKDLSGIDFKKSPLQDSFEKLDKTIQDLIATLGGVPGAIEKIGRTNVSPIDIPVNYVPGPLPSGVTGGGFTPPSVGHLGGHVTAQGIQRFHRGIANVLPFARRMHSGGLAGDEVPAILQTGEAVLNRRAASTLGRSAINAINSGQAGGVVEVHTTLEVDGQVLAKVVDRHLMNQLRVKSRLAVA
jgi:methyl-accepting chemotaxis protein